MQRKKILFILGLLASCFAFFLLCPAVLSFFYDEYQTAENFFFCFAGTLVLGCFTAFLFRPQDGEKIQLTTRDGLAIVGLCWLTATFICAMPYMLVSDISPARAIFEAASGLSTTGASIYPDVEILPKGILFWRSFTQWIGGLGIIVFSLALLPFIGAGGMQLYKAESTGISKDKVAPKMIDTARSLWGIYLILTLTLIVLLYLQGMSFFDALTHSLSTLATGGFSTKNASIAAFSPISQWTIIIFMYLGSINFTLHFLFLHNGIREGFKKYLQNEEFVYYTLFLISGIIILAGCLYFSKTPAQYILSENSTAYSLERVLRDSCFQLVSLTTSTGFATADYINWPLFAQIVLLIFMMCGACAGSTSGGIKFMRIIIIFKLIRNELNRLSHPRAIERIKINGNPVEDTALKGVLIFFSLYFVSVFLATLTLTSPILDMQTAFTAVISSISNIGPAFGILGPSNNFSILNDSDLTILSFLMIYGRLEIFTVLLIFMPNFWRS